MPGGAANSLAVYGPLGAIVAVLLPFCWWLIKKESDRYDQEKADNKHLNNVMREGLVEAIVKATEQLRASNEILSQFQVQYRAPDGPYRWQRDDGDDGQGRRQRQERDRYGGREDEGSPRRDGRDA